MKLRSRTMLRSIAILLTGIGKTLVCLGGVIAFVGAAMPWAKADLFGAVHVSVPGLFFLYGGIAAGGGGAALIFRRTPLISLAIGITVLAVTVSAATSIPHSVRGELIGAQLSFGPFNQLLDQFHIATVMVGDYGARDVDFIGEGIQKTALGAELIICGSVLALADDPTVDRLRRRLLKHRCEECLTTWPIARDVRYCPNCSAPTSLSYEFCSTCSGPLEHSDRYCVQCGTETPTPFKAG